MKIGYQFKPIDQGEMTHTKLVQYAGASGDFNPIHTVVPYAKEEAGLDDVIAHGMMIMGFMGRAITEWVDQGKLKKFSTRFMKMTKPGEKISVRGKIVDEMSEYWIGEVEAVNEMGEVKAKGIFEIEK